MKTPDTLSIRDALSRANTDLGKLAASAKKIQSYNSFFDSLLESPLRSHLTVANLRDGRLVLLADSPAWASRARLKLPDIQKALSQNTLGDRVAGIQIVTRPRPTKPEATQTRRPRISESTRKLLNDVAEDTENPGLRRALRNIARRDP